jgi:hypothetical protein
MALPEYECAYYKMQLIAGRDLYILISNLLP